MSGTLPAFYEITSDDHAGAIVVVSIILIITSLCVAGVRLFVTRKQRAAVQLDDITYALAGILAIIQSILYWLAADHGLGKHMSKVDKSDVLSFFKLMYAGQIFGVGAMAAAKVSLVMLFRRIAPAAHWSFLIPFVMVLLWAGSSMLAVSLQCIPEPWYFAPTKCSSHGLVLLPVIITNMLTDLILSLGILPTVWKLQTERRIKMTVTCLFASRVVVPIISIGYIIKVVQSLKSEDQTCKYHDDLLFNYSNIKKLGVLLSRSIWELFLVHFSVIMATVPRIHSFWASLQTGAADVRIPDGAYNESIRQSSNKASTSNTTSKSGTRKARASESRRDHDIKLSRLIKGQTHNNTKRTRSPPLRLVPDLGTSFCTHIYSGDNEDERAILSTQEDERSSKRNSKEQLDDHGVWKNYEVTMEVECSNHLTKLSNAVI